MQVDSVFADLALASHGLVHTPGAYLEALELQQMEIGPDKAKEGYYFSPARHIVSSCNVPMAGGDLSRPSPDRNTPPPRY